MLSFMAAAATAAMANENSIHGEQLLTNILWNSQAIKNSSVELDISSQEKVLNFEWKPEIKSFKNKEKSLSIETTGRTDAYKITAQLVSSQLLNTASTRQISVIAKSAGTVLNRNEPIFIVGGDKMTAVGTPTTIPPRLAVSRTETKKIAVDYFIDMPSDNTAVKNTNSAESDVYTGVVELRLIASWQNH
ncbi:hypothetical protein [Iodobacter sp.]|uniref:hypothetical protein n=1 Tax=Iodobacter sp. TaxID=1915058 RepID=UPI0025FFC3A6|nr:hypothetical protein [Iodobacter sp.]